MDAAAAAAPALGTFPGHDALETLFALARENQTGLLKVGTTAPAWVALADGQIVVAGSADGPSIAHALATAGVIDEPTLHRCGARGGSHDLAVLEDLVQTHDRDALAPVVHAQAVHAVFQMLLPPREASVFLPGPPITLARYFAFPVESIVGLARARVREWATIAESIPSTQAVFRPRRRLAPELDHVTMTRDDWAVLAVLDGRRSVAQAIAAAGRSPYDVCLVLHHLIEGGLIERTA